MSRAQNVIVGQTISCGYLLEFRNHNPGDPPTKLLQESTGYKSCSVPNKAAHHCSPNLDVEVHGQGSPPREQDLAVRQLRDLLAF